MPHTPATSRPDSSPQVRMELIRLGYSDLPLGLLITFLCANGLAWVAARSGYSTHAWAWLAVMSVLTLARGATVLWYRQSRRFSSPQAWERRFLAGALLTGLSWGYAGWAFYPVLDGTERSLLILVLAGITAGATRSLSSILPACWAFQITTLSPLIARFLLGSESVQILTGCLTSLYILFVLVMARSFNQSLANSLRLGFDDDQLLAELQEKTRITEQLNRDLTEENRRRQTIEVELREARDRAEAASQAKSEFLATISHEIRTPMNGILGMLELLKSSSLTPAQREQVETSANSADSLLRILNDILDFSKIETGMMDLESIPLQPRALMEEVITLMRPRATAKSVSLRFDCFPAADITVLGDPTRLRQVLLNLVANAIKFTPAGSVELSLDAQPVPGKKIRLQVMVRDTGIGMNEETRTSLFQPYRQGDSSTNRLYGGSGLGLAISQRLMHRMGGEITVQSRPGQGSEFTLVVVLPLADKEKRLPILPADVTIPSHFSGRVLIVEDDKVNQRVITLMLERMGLSCHAVEDGYTAISILQQGNWDLVLMDCQLPGIDGYETTRRAMAALGKLTPPIVALTANVRPEDREKARLAGMVDFLAKPVRLGTLRACLARWLPALH